MGPPLFSAVGFSFGGIEKQRRFVLKLIDGELVSHSMIAALALLTYDSRPILALI